MARTSTHLANKALSKLKKVGLGQSPDAEDTAKMLEAYPSLVATLSSEDIYTIADSADIADDAFEWLALYLAYIAAPDFSEPQDDGMRTVAEYHLKLIQAAKPTYEVMKAEHF
jgi:hypothetical protein